MHAIVLVLLVGDAAAAACTCCCCCRPVNDSIRPIEPQGPFEIVDETTIGEFIIRVISQLFACSYGCLLAYNVAYHVICKSHASHVPVGHHSTSLHGVPMA
jgi:hypothetical protein